MPTIKMTSRQLLYINLAGLCLGHLPNSHTVIKLDESDELANFALVFLCEFLHSLL